ncbi:DUF262 domain-containing protein [Wujia sp.]|uniref:DUF262 domain-containing protein n=1 Tax=Wujia sp. TaxID=2944172 RepID=UPI003F7F20F0
MKLLDTAEIKDLQSLITNGNILNIKVKFYQRPYRWTAKKVTDLFEDYRDNRESALMNGDNSKEYFIGAVVFVDERVQEEKDSGKIWKYQVVDGQQRFTTLFLFNYIKYILLVKKVDEAARGNKSRDFNASLEAMEACYKGFIGEYNVNEIERANSDLSNAFDNANQQRIDIDLKDLNKWRQRVGWIADPDISANDYYEKCRAAMYSFLQNEELGITYENDNFNKYFKEALAKIVIKFSNASEAAFCLESEGDYDENDETQVEFPYVQRAFGIFEQIKQLYKVINPNAADSYIKLCGYINLIDEMLENIKLCMIVSSDEDDAYKLFETLNDRSESVNDLELLKNYFYKTYTETSGEPQKQVLKNISMLDNRWRDIFFKYAELEPEIFEYMTVFFSGNTSKNTNERKRKLIKNYLSSYKRTYKPYSFEVINRDFYYIEYIQKILLKIHRIDMTAMRKVSEDSQMSLFIENDLNASIVKRVLGLAMNLPYPVVVASLICDIIHNYANNANNGTSFDIYLEDVLNEERCKIKYPGLWKDACVLWKVTILSRNYESPKLLSDILAEKCNISRISVSRKVEDQIIQFDANVLEESEVYKEFQEWISEWKFSDGAGKIKIKNLFMHLFLKYDLDKNTGRLKRASHIVRTYAIEAIKQDLDHMDASRMDKQNKTRYFHYNLTDRTDFTNGLGNMIPLPVAINRGKHNTPMKDTMTAFSEENLTGWIFDEAIDLFQKNHTIINNYEVPTEAFFNKRKDLLIAYFKRIVKNQKYNPDNEV